VSQQSTVRSPNEFGAAEHELDHVKKPYGLLEYGASEILARP